MALPVPVPARLLRYAISHAADFPALPGQVYLRRLLETSADIVQWRETDPPAARQLQWLREVLPVARAAGKVLIVNSDTELAVESGADGVHYKAASLDAAPPAGAGLLVGRSAHSLEQVRRACEAGCDYLLLSPIFDPRSKPSVMPALGIERTLEAARRLAVPVFALGGIRPEHWSMLQDSGLAGLAGISWARDEIRAAEPPL